MGGRRSVLAGVVAGALLGATIVRPPTIRAQPADIDRAKDLYTSGRKAMDEKRYADAVRDFGAAYDVSKDPALFYWIANANAQSGHCDIALIYYGRYVKEGHPAEAVLPTVKERITACGGDPTIVGATGSGSGSDNVVVEPVGSGSGSAVPVGSGSGSGSDLAPPPPLKARHQGPWLMVGGSIALVTIGAVLAYSANASENDISDLYVGLEGTPPEFDARTKKRYDDLIAEGKRYETLSRVSFGLAAGLGIGAAVWFYVTRDKSKASEKKTVRITPNEHHGISATVQW
jgi:hypothetical protein